MAELFKNLYNETYIKLLCKNIQKHYTNFDQEKFTYSIFDKTWKELELKQRMRHISTTLGIYLTNSYKSNIDILVKAFFKMPTNLALENMVFQDFVEVYGLDEVDISLDALEQFTKNSSSEFAIRAFILKDSNTTIQRMKQWAKHENEHVRRLASEGCRPRLPWAVALPEFKKDPTLVLEILELLYDDSSEYVRKSVANNLNDISKNNPNIVINIVSKYIGQNQQKDKLLKHASRTLLKQSDAKILKLFGYKTIKNIKIENFEIQNKVEIGDSLEFSFDIKSKENLGKLRVEYIVEFVRLNNKTNKKVFMISDSICKANHKSISKKHSFKAITTRKYYSGIHKIYVNINGIECISSSFELIYSTKVV
jgi:3-methyladenine DNA glycosylase AlkC